ncbi:NTP transferase domain-containing protein [Flavonifractor plautii]|uniref:MobA-like NTP transferase domain-containing protein n=1 Tax=Flavonifractor plautii ATCC 29863 TaxID=411475 RepID=G9YQ38_FLAPL|nr:NTP transferase domain-containing protein [Flavonifractor plautii]EHM52089.1 hypothetical protein HMPREF0372_01631 [Flavonifractor plautii ATCC 29863]QIA32384.1 NTP transferase domain-containing protein [Flavonifractor plautii]
MTYIILAAGSGTRLHPITLTHPKTLFSLDGSTTILSRMVGLLRTIDPGSTVVIVTGFQHQQLENAVQMENVVWVYNPFYAVTNSIASLWFAQEYLKDQVTVLNGDIVMSRELLQNIVTQDTEYPYVLMDASILKHGDYNVQANGERVVVMSRDLSTYSGEYAGVTKLDGRAAEQLRHKVCEMVERGLYNHWYEDALVQMIFENDFELRIRDIQQYQWTEVDDVDDLVCAKRIHCVEQ